MFKNVTEAEFKAFLETYPRTLSRNVSTIFDPPNVNYNDFKRAPYWPDSVVASYNSGNPPSGFRVLTDIDSPVEDDGKRDTHLPLYDRNGTLLQEGDEVEVLRGSRGTKLEPEDRRRETILIRDKGSKYESWSFESCYNHARGFDMLKVVS